MVKEIKIQNYKSVQDLTLELGRINVLIGANGCGKSNILEAIAFGSAAADNKLDKEFLSARGIRVTEPKAMRSGFGREFQNKTINIKFEHDVEIILEHDNMPFSNWKINMAGKVRLMQEEVERITSYVMDVKNGVKNDKIEEYGVKDLIEKIQLLNDFNAKSKRFEDIIAKYQNFLIYAPENTFLRKFEDDEKTSPIGIRGEGLFDLLNEMNQNQPEEFQEIIENLELIDWFDGFEIPKDLVFTERRIRIKDRFLEEGLQYFDQRSSNEGFLFLMFYFALFISKYTPKFFAIDNIDASLNPKLCIELIKILTKLAKKHDKQVIFTTHNPAILDGLNLNDDEVRLLVVNRNIHGHTKVKRVLKKEMPEGVEPLRLSEQFLRGYLGGLPKNF